MEYDADKERRKRLAREAILKQNEPPRVKLQQLAELKKKEDEEEAKSKK